MRWRAILPALGALVLLASGCGGKHRAPVAGQTPAPTVTEAATPQDPETRANCEQLLALRGEVAKALSGTGGIDPQAPRSLAELARKAPPEIRPDARRIAAAAGPIMRALHDADVAPSASPDPAAVQRLARVIDSLDRPALDRATANVSRWVDTHCGS